MLNIKNDDYKLLYDLEVSLKDSVEITKIKEGEKPSIMSDTMFKTMFYNDNRIKYGAKFLSYYLDITYEELLSKIKLTKESLNKEKENSKDLKSDYVAIIDDTMINIEVNNNKSKETMERNIEYANRLYQTKNKKGKKYKYMQVIQFNLNNFSFKTNDKIIDIYTMQNKEGIRLHNKIIIIQIYIPNLRRKWYTKGIQSLTEEERYALALIEKDIVTSKELGGGINIMEEYMEEVEKVMDDEYFGESYDKEMALQEEYYERGKEAGEKEKSLEIAKHLLENNIDIEIIEKSTGLNKEELIKLKDYS